MKKGIPTYIVDDSFQPPPGAMVHPARVLKGGECGDPEIDKLFDEAGPITMEDLEGSSDPLDKFLAEFFSPVER